MEDIESEQNDELRNDGDDADPDTDGLGRLACLGISLCLCCLFIIMSVVYAIRWNTWPSCDVAQSKMIWNTVMPPETSMHFRQQWFWMPSRVDVYKTSEGNVEMGYWSDLDVFVNRRIVYIDTRRGEDPMLEARRPWGLYMGLRYDLWRCGGRPEETFHIVQDVWETAWFFNWDRAKAFNIANGTGPIAKSFSRTKNHIMSSLFSEKEIEVTDMHGQTIATIRQESQLQAGFSNRRYFIKNLRQDIIPNEVVSFLGGIWELNGVKEKNDKKSTSASRRRRR